MITFTGRHIRPDIPNTPNELDIAVGMGRICRYAGSLWWTNIAHSILVAEILARWPSSSRETWAWGLLHDAHECVTGDVTHPYKPESLRAEQRKLDARIREYFGLNERHIDDEAVDRADERAVVAEAVTLGYAGFIQAHTADLGRWDEPLPWQLQMARELGKSAWTDAATITDPGSQPVQHFRTCLSMIRSGKILEARQSLLRELPPLFSERASCGAL